MPLQREMQQFKNPCYFSLSMRLHTAADQTHFFSAFKTQVKKYWPKPQILYFGKNHSVVCECFSYGRNKNLIRFLCFLFRIYIHFLPRYILVLLLINKVRDNCVCLKPLLK